MIPALSILLVILAALALPSFVCWLRGYLDERRVWREQRRRQERLGLVVERRRDLAKSLQ
jgi:hypothetical protein